MAAAKRPARKKREPSVWVVEVHVGGAWTPILRDGEITATSARRKAQASASAHCIVRNGKHRAAEYRRVPTKRGRKS